MTAKHARLRGLFQLIEELVVHGSAAIERVQKEKVRQPFEILEKVVPLPPIVEGIHEIHDVAVSSTHTMIRLVTHVVGQGAGLALDWIESHPGKTVEEAVVATAESPAASSEGNELP